MVGSIIALVLGGFLVINGALTWWRLLRWYPRRRTARGVFVGREDRTVNANPGTVSRAGRFRFTTEDGRAYERVSSFSSFPGPKPGREVTVAYDPARPESTADRSGVLAFQATVLGPLFIALGAFIAIMGLRGL